MTVVSEIPVTDTDIERETPLYIRIDNIEQYGDLSIFSKQLTLAEYERFDATFRYSLFCQIFSVQKNDEKIDSDMQKMLQDDLNSIKINTYRELLKQLCAMSSYSTKTGLKIPDLVEFLYNCRELTQEDLIIWAMAVLKYNVAYKKKVLDILQGKEFPLGSLTESASTSFVSNVQGFQPLGEVFANI